MVGTWVSRQPTIEYQLELVPQAGTEPKRNCFMPTGEREEPHFRGFEFDGLEKKQPLWWRGGGRGVVESEIQLYREVNLGESGCVPRGRRVGGR